MLGGYRESGATREEVLETVTGRPAMARDEEDFHLCTFVFSQFAACAFKRGVSS